MEYTGMLFCLVLVCFLYYTRKIIIFYMAFIMFLLENKIDFHSAWNCLLLKLFKTKNGKMFARE